MGSDEHDRTAPQYASSSWSSLCRTGGIAAWILVVYCLATMVQLIVLGGPPATASEAFRLLHDNRLQGLLRLDLPTVCVMPLYYLLFLGLYAALIRAEPAYTAVATLLGFAGVTLVLATPTALSMVPLSDKYAAATTESVRLQLEAAGEAILASDIWHGTGAMIGGVLLQSGAVLICVAMLRNNIFSKTTAYLGILMHGLDLAHAVLGPFWPAAGLVLMAIAGPLYLLWLPLVGRRLFRLAKGHSSIEQVS